MTILQTCFWFIPRQRGKGDVPLIISLVYIVFYAVCFYDNVLDLTVDVLVFSKKNIPGVVYGISPL